jgi:hypothetical protein
MHVPLNVKFAYLLVFEINYISTNLHSFHAVNAALETKECPFTYGIPWTHNLANRWQWNTDRCIASQFM